jgi:DHA1 family multidrug resistance protein-like MFS transporter
VLGGFVGGHIGMRAVFVGTSVLLITGAAYSWLVRPRNAATADRK